MKTKLFLSASIFAVAVMAGCTTVPANNANLDQARSDYRNAQASSQVTTLAAAELKTAGDSLDRANSALSRGDSNAYVHGGPCRTDLGGSNQIAELSVSCIWSPFVLLLA